MIKKSPKYLQKFLREPYEGYRESTGRKWGERVRSGPRSYLKKCSGIENRQSRRKRMPRNEAVARRATSIFETMLNVEKRRSLRVTSTVGTAANLQGGRGRVQ